MFVQNYKNIELIFSDDGSDLFDKRGIEDYIEKNKTSNIIKYHVYDNEFNVGTVKHLNKLIKKAKGEYLKILAVDDAFYCVNSISKAIESLENSDCNIGVGMVVLYDEFLKTEKGIKPSKEEICLIEKAERKQLHKMICVSGGFLPAPGRFYKREYFEVYGLYDEQYRLLEDKPLVSRAIRSGCKIHFINSRVSKYRLAGITRPGKTNEILKKDRMLFCEKEVYPYWGISIPKNIKKFIVWGTSSKYTDNKSKLQKIGFEYFIDSDKGKEGIIIDKKKVYPPHVVDQEKKDDVFIIICCDAYLEIGKWLSDLGFIENTHYTNINFIKDSKMH